MADREPVAGRPCRTKRKRTQKDFSDFVTEDPSRFVDLLEDPDFDEWCEENVSSDDSSDWDSDGGEGDSVGVVQTGGDMASIVRRDAERGERAELEAEYRDSDSAADPDFDPERVSGHSGSESDSDSAESVTHRQSADAGDSSASDADLPLPPRVCQPRGRGRGWARGVGRRGVGRGRGAAARGRAAGGGGAAALVEPLEPPNNRQPQVPPFTGQPGIQVPVDGNSPLDYYRLFLTVDLLDLFVRETNLYAHQVLAASQPTRQHSRLNKWTDTDRVEMEKFLGLVFLMGLVSKPSIISYWSTSPILFTPIFSETMSRDRFQAI